MPPVVCPTSAATPELPLPPVPVGHATATPRPYFVDHAGLTLARKSVKLNVVPELSERCTIAIDVDGRLTPGFSFLIAGSSHVLTWPMKIFASVGPSMWSRFLTPGRL